MMRNCPAYLIISDGHYSLYSFTFTCNQITTLRKGRKCNLFTLVRLILLKLIRLNRFTATDVPTQTLRFGV